MEVADMTCLRFDGAKLGYPLCDWTTGCNLFGPSQATLSLMNDATIAKKKENYDLFSFLSLRL
ncbi:hypothetical protein QQP08_002159 [Theobroma cacao]|nr:hypothetical protein QQP08_002159 [Theobroma cacao]